MSIPLFPWRRVKSLLWLAAIVVLLQLFVFTADQVWLKKTFVEDCSALKFSTGSSSKDNKPFIALQNDVALRTTTERETSNDSDGNPTVKETWNKAALTSTIATTPTDSKTLNIKDDRVIPASFTKKDLSSDESAVDYDCKELRNRPLLNGSLNMHEWYGWCGCTVDDLRREPLFPFKPHVNDRLGRFATNITERRNSGRRLFGYVHPPITGAFIFAISSADGSELWLSTDDDPQNSKKIAYLGDPDNQYAAATRFAEFTSKKSQISGKIRLEAAKVYYVEVLQKQKKNKDHVEVAWQIPGKEKLEIIESRYISQYIDYSAGQAEITARMICICKDHPILPFAYNKFMSREKYDLRDDFQSRGGEWYWPFRFSSHHGSGMYRFRSDCSLAICHSCGVTVETLSHLEVSDVLPSCPYSPSYLLSRKLEENEAFVKGYIKHPRVYPDDRTDVNMSHDINNHISWGNKKLPKDEALQIVSSYMEALTKRIGERFSLKNIVNVEEKIDPRKGIRYLLDLELDDKTKGRSVRLSEYVYKPHENSTGLCYPDGFQWRRNVSVSMVVTVKNYGQWIKFLISQLALLYKQGSDRNFFLIIVDFNSTDVDLFKLREKSGIKDRIVIIQQFTEFYKTKALNDGVAYVKDPNSIIFTADLHIRFPANIFDEIRKHAIQGRSFYSPAVLKLKCGYTIEHQQAYWEMMGYGLFGGYKSDWDRFEGMDAVKFTTRWGGEDWDLIERAIGANLEIERLRLPKMYHYHHERVSDWYEYARM